jgi:hypothetical protein
MTAVRFPSAPTVVVHAPHRTARHEAAFDWVLSAALGLPWRWEDDAEAHRAADGVRMHYGVEGEWPGVGFPADGLLDRTGSLDAAPLASEDGQADLFSAVFWMASRMEEFLPDAPRDGHGRFDPTGSLPELRGWLDSPICEQWAWTIGERLLGNAWPEHRNRLRAEHAVVPTLDVDSAYAFRGKGLVRTGGAWARDVFRGQWVQAVRRLRAAAGQGQDPYDTYGQVEEAHRSRGLTTQWFFLLAAFGSYDRGLPASSLALADLMKRLDDTEGHSVGWHPGYAAASDAKKMAAECQSYRDIMGRLPVASRQHYLRMVLSETRRQLFALGVREDHTEGHAVRTGWRGGFARPRRWYDLERETLTDLVLVPFAAMDATYLRYLCTPASEVPARVGALAHEAKKWGAPLRLLWHNESLSGEGQWAGWEDVYTQTLDAACR